jgi:hypothetical protein
LVATLPIDHHGIVRAAEEMINDYGSQALTTARKRAQELRSEGFDSVANTWDLISEVIKDQQDSDDKPEAYKSALKSNVFLSE